MRRKIKAKGKINLSSTDNEIYEQDNSLIWSKICMAILTSRISRLRGIQRPLVLQLVTLSEYGGLLLQTYKKIET